MLSVVTLVAILLSCRAYCLEWIRQRDAWAHKSTKPTQYVHMVGSRPAPWYLRIFGEQHGWEAISIRFVPWTEPEPELSDAQLAHYRRLQRLYPEATISTSPLDGRRPTQLRTIP